MLQELTVSSYVPNDTHIVGGKEASDDTVRELETPNPSMLLLTGPNFSGKSVYMKQVSGKFCILRIVLLTEH